MKNLFNGILRLLVKVALHLFYKKISITGKENIPKKGPIILVANHQNALIDPLLIATHTQLNPWFLTRASVFQNPLIAKILHLIRMLPVYRVRDGFSTLTQNQQTFEACYDILQKGGTVVIFAEGSHSHVRNVRPLSKGFTRLAFGLKERFPEINPVVLPFGMDFSAHKRSGSRVHLHIGAPIPIDLPSTASGVLRKKVEQALKSLVVEFPNEDYESQLKKALEAGIDLTSKKEVDTFLSGKKRTYTVSHPGSLANKVMKLYHLPLLGIWKVIQPKIKDEVFYATFKFLIGFFLAPLWYGLLWWITWQSSWAAWSLSFLLMAWISLIWNKNPQE